MRFLEVGDAKYVEAERFGAVKLLMDEMVRESPPLPERDDSPPPLHRGKGNGNCRKSVFFFCSNALKRCVFKMERVSRMDRCLMRLYFSAMARSVIEGSH